MDPVSAALISKSLDGLALRMDVTASNIANANSRTFRPSQVRFEDSLRAAAAQGVDAIAAVRLRIEGQPAGHFGDEPRMDLDLDTAAATSGRYSALIEMLGRELDIMRTVIKGGQ